MSNLLHIATYQREVHRGIPVKEHLTRDLPKFSKSVVIRLGGTMPYAKYEIQINSSQAVSNSVDKLKQKQLLLNAGLPTQPVLENPVFPCVIKAVKRSGGLKVKIAQNEKEFKNIKAEMPDGFYIEPLFVSTSEYRLHCTKKEVFFAVKKHKRNPNDVIITRDNHYNTREFQIPRLWEQIKTACIKAMNVLDLDIACFDVMYSSAGQHSFTICEANTNPELLANTYAAYLEQLTKLINEKIKAQPVKKEEVVVVVKAPIVKEKIPNVEVHLRGDQKLRAINAIINDDYKLINNLLTIKL